MKECGKQRKRRGGGRKELEGKDRKGEDKGNMWRVGKDKWRKKEEG